VSRALLRKGRLRDSFRESSVVAGLHEQTHPAELQDRAPPATARHGSRRKIDIGVDEQTLEIRAIEITGSNVGDAPRLPELLDQLPADVELGAVTADGALRAPPVRG